MPERIEPNRFAERERPTFRTTTFQELGIADTRGTLPWMMRQEVDIGRVQHPFDGDPNGHMTIVIAGEDLNYRTLGQLANAVVPFGGIGNGVMVADLIIKQHAKSGNPGDYYHDLHKDHTIDEVIGPEYRRFMAKHNGRWLAILEGDKASEQVEYVFMGLRFVSAREEAQKLDETLRRIASIDASNPDMYTRNAVFNLGNVLLYSGKYPQFEQMLENKVAQYPQHEELRIESARNLYFHSTVLENAGYITEYTADFDQVAKEQLAMIQREYHDSFGVFVDLEQKRVWGAYGASVSILDETTLKIVPEDGGEERSTIATLAHTNDFRKWKVDRVSGMAYRPGITGVLAIINSNGQRRLATQEELLSVLPPDTQDKEDLDVYGGRLELAYLSEEIVDGFDKTMFLAHRKTKDPQNMMGAQAAVWLSLDHPDFQHAQRLLSDDNPVVTAIESFANSATMDTV